MTGGVDWDWRLKDPRYSRGRVLGRQHRARQRGGDRRAAAEHRALLPAAGRGPPRPTTRRSTVDERPRRLAAASEDRRRARPVQLQRVASRRPGSTINDVGFHAARRRDHAVELGAVPLGHADEALPQLPPQPEPVGGLELRRRSRATPAPTSTRTSCCTSNWSAGAGVNLEGAGIDDRSTRGGPAFRSKQRRERLVLRRDRQPEGGQRRLAGLLLPRRGRLDVPRRATREISWRPTSFLTLSGGVQLREDERGHAVGRERRRPVGDPLRLRPHPADDGRPHGARQLHHHADAHRADLRRSRSCRPATTATSRN